MQAVEAGSHKGLAEGFVGKLLSLPALLYLRFKQ